MVNSPRPTSPSLTHTEKTPPYTFHNTQKNYNVWHPGFFPHAPWVALLAIILAIGCAAASIVIIVISNNHTATWKIQPSVLLGFLAGASTAMLALALSSGVAITWWRAVSDPRGTTMASLHYIWNYGGSGSTPWLAGKHVNKIAIASVLTAITGIAYSPLLQRASRTESQNIASNATMYLEIYNEIPTGYSGTVGNAPGEAPGISANFLDDIQNWYSGNELYTNSDPSWFCNGTCSGSVPTAGLRITDGGYSLTTQPLDLKTAAAEGTQVFSINFTRYDDLEDIPTLEIMVQYITSVDTKCSATLVTEICKVHLAPVLYPIIIQNTTVGPWASFKNISIAGQSFADPGDLSTALPGSPCGPLSALQWFGNSYYESNATVRYNATSGEWTAFQIGLQSHQYFDTDSNDYIEDLSCGFQWDDPMDDILDDFANVLFYAAFLGDSYADVTQNFTALQTQTTLIYHSEYSFLAAATAVVCIAIIGVSITLWGWWELGRKVSLSPLETARAFGAMVFQHWTLPVNGAGIAKEMGTGKFRYEEGLVTEDDGVARPMLVIAPVNVRNSLAEPSQLGNL